MARDKHDRELRIGDVVSLRAVVTACGADDRDAVIEILRDGDSVTIHAVITEKKSDDKLLVVTVLPPEAPPSLAYRIPIVVPGNQLELYKPRAVPPLKMFQDTAILKNDLAGDTPPDPRRVE